MKKKGIVLNSGSPRGITPEAIKKLRKTPSITAQATTGQNVARRKVYKKTSTRGTNKKEQPLVINRPSEKYLTTLATKITRLDLPEAGSFNAGLVQIPNSKDLICVYRPDERSFVGCILNEDLSIRKNSYFPFNISNCADPRLIWTADNKLLMAYSSTEEVGFRRECIRGSIIMDLNVSDQFLQNKPFRISPTGMEERQKNWMPFRYQDKIYFVASICPHIIYELDGEVCKKVHETQWFHPWMFKDFLRGNTNFVQLDDGNYLGTFHTATWYGGRKCYYDNGCYLFSGKPPFKVLKCSNRTYLRAEDATEPHFRKKEILVCTFPVGMVRDGERILISYGDNDSCVKIMETTVQDMLDLMLDVY